MSEKFDPYFQRRMETARQHRVVRTIEVEPPKKEAEDNRDYANPTLGVKIEALGWSEKAVANVIDAVETGKIRIKRAGDDAIIIEFLPLQDLPEVLGQVSELNVVQKNLKGDKVFGSCDIDKLTYLQTTDFAVEGYMDDESGGQNYGRLYVDTQKLQKKRNVYLDPESLHETDYEYGFAFCIRGGIPFEAIQIIDVIRARQVPYKPSGDSKWIDDVESYMSEQARKLREFIDKKLGQTK